MSIGLAVVACAIATPAVSATRAATRIGTLLDLTPGNAHIAGSPAVAIGKDGRTLVAWVTEAPPTAQVPRPETALIVRSGPSPGQLSAPQTVVKGASPGQGTLVAAVGPDGTAAIAWMAPGLPHNTRVYVSVAPPGGRFGAAQRIDRGDAVQALNGIGVDGGRRVAVEWNGDNPHCCESGTVRYAVGSNGTFSPPRTLPQKHHYDGQGQVLETADGGLALTGIDQLFALDATGDGIAALPAPPMQALDSGGPSAYAAGPTGIGAALTTTEIAEGDIGASVLPTGATSWSTPTYVAVPEDFAHISAPYPSIAFAQDGAIVLAGIFGGDVILANAPPGGVLGGPLTFGHVMGYSVDPEPSDPHVVTFGHDAALTWVTDAGTRFFLHLRVQQPSSRPPVQTFTQHYLAGPVSASNASTAAVAWIGDGHLQLWWARGT